MCVLGFIIESKYDQPDANASLDPDAAAMCLSPSHNSLDENLRISTACGKCYFLYRGYQN